MPDMTDRDYFAAAALTGLLAQGDDGSFSEESYARGAYRWADAMLRERERMNHDAAPAARADLPDERPPHAVSANGGTPSAASRDGNGTGDTQEPAAWAVLRVGGGWVSILANEVQAETSRKSFDKMENWVHEIVPLYRKPTPTLTDAEVTFLLRERDLLDADDEGDRKTLEIIAGLLARLGGGR